MVLAPDSGNGFCLSDHRSFIRCYAMERVSPAAPPLPTASAAIQTYYSMSIFPLPDLRSAHQLVRSELLAQLQTDPERGLSGATARRRLEAWGNNQIQEVTGPAWYTLLARQFWSLLVAERAHPVGQCLAVDYPVGAADVRFCHWVVPAAEHYDLLLPGQHDGLLFYTLLCGPVAVRTGTTRPR